MFTKITKPAAEIQEGDRVVLAKHTVIVVTGKKNATNGRLLILSDEYPNGVHALKRTLFTVEVPTNLEEEQ